MIFSLANYLRRECAPHWRALVFDSQLPLSFAAVVLAVYRPGLPATSTVGKLSESALSYGSMSFGFAITVYVLALTLPQPEIIRMLAGHREEGEPTDAYHKLLFIFSWTALTQGALVIIALFTQMNLDPASVVRRSTFNWRSDLLLCLEVFLLSYAVLQFLNAVLSVAQLGRIIARKSREVVVGERQRAGLASVKKQGAAVSHLAS